MLKNPLAMLPKMRVGHLLGGLTKLVASQDLRRSNTSTNHMGKKMLQSKKRTVQSMPFHSIRKVFTKASLEYLGHASAQFRHDARVSVGNVRLSGRIIVDAEPEFLHFVDMLKKQRVKILRLNLKDLKIMSFTAFWGFIKFVKSAKRRGAIVEIIGVNPIILDLLNGHGVTKYFKLVPTQEYISVQDHCACVKPRYRGFAA